LAERHDDARGIATKELRALVKIREKGRYAPPVHMIRLTDMVGLEVGSGSRLCKKVFSHSLGHDRQNSL